VSNLQERRAAVARIVDDWTRPTPVSTLQELVQRPEHRWFTLHPGVQASVASVRTTWPLRTKLLPGVSLPALWWSQAPRWRLRDVAREALLRAARSGRR
jgi:hypothetical protein